MIKDDKLLKDLMRGFLWEQKYRGALESLAPEHLAQLRERAARSIGAGGVITEFTLTLPPRLTESIKFPSLVGWGSYKWKYGADVVEEALERRLPLIDTAEGYGFGKVEECLGKVLRNYKGRRTWIASKFARNHSSYEAVRNAAKRSRDKLNISMIDIYQVHWPVPEKFDEVFRALRSLIDEGVINRVGVCNFSSLHLWTAWSIAKCYDVELDTLQTRINQDDLSAFETLVPNAQALGLKVIAHSPLGQRKTTTAANQIAHLTGKGIFVIPGTNNLKHLRENIAAAHKNTPPKGEVEKN